MSEEKKPDVRKNHVGGILLAFAAMAILMGLIYFMPELFTAK